MDTLPSPQAAGFAPQLPPTADSPQPHSSAGDRSVVLTPLTGIRFLAALQLFFFHLLAFHQAPEPGNKFPAFDAMPRPVLNLIERGICSTSLFFLLSGFILTYLYVDAEGRFTSARRGFWIARLSRIYPLHLLLLLLLAFPVIQFSRMFGATNFDLAAGGLLCAGLLQAWVPKYALAWNFPTWALSVVAFFYLVFPAAARWLQPLSRRTMAGLLAALPLLSLVPTVVYIALAPPVPPALFGFWAELIARNPLLWLPHFLMGMLLARYFGISCHSSTWQRRASRPWLTWGDATFAALVLVEMFVMEVPAGWLGSAPVPIHGFLLRHGALAPMYYVIVHDLALQRGCLSRLLTLPGMKTLGDASFSIFMLQLPAFIVLPPLTARWGLGPTQQLLFVAVVTVIVSVLSTNLFEKPVARWLRRRLDDRRIRSPRSGQPHGAAPPAGEIPPPHGQNPARSVHAKEMTAPESPR